MGGPGEKGFAYTLEVGVTGKPRPVTVRGVTGTYHRSDDSSLEVLELPDGRIKFHLTAFHKGLNWKEYGPNLGEASGLVPLRNGTARYEDEVCKLRFQFGKDSVEIHQEGDCDFGHNVTAGGSYRKTSRCAAPKDWEDG